MFHLPLNSSKHTKNANTKATKVKQSVIFAISPKATIHEVYCVGIWRLMIYKF